MLVICDTTPINYLVQIELVDLIPRLFTNACIPDAVWHELMHPSAPGAVRSWASNLPNWVVVKEPGTITDPALLSLHPGEREAIALAHQLDAQFLLTDDYNARAVAHSRGLNTLTTLLILDAAADRGWLRFNEAIHRLLTTNFRVDRLTIEKLLEKHS